MIICTRAYVYTQELGTLTASQHNIFDTEKLSQICHILQDCTLFQGMRWTTRRDGPTLWQKLYGCLEELQRNDAIRLSHWTTSVTRKRKEDKFNHPLPCKLCQWCSLPSWPTDDWKHLGTQWCSPALCSSDRQAGEPQARTGSGWFPWRWRWWVGQLALGAALCGGTHVRVHSFFYFFLFFMRHWIPGLFLYISVWTMFIWSNNTAPQIPIGDE